MNRCVEFSGDGFCFLLCDDPALFHVHRTSECVGARLLWCEGENCLLPVGQILLHVHAAGKSDGRDAGLVFRVESELDRLANLHVDRVRLEAAIDHDRGFLDSLSLNRHLRAFLHLGHVMPLLGKSTAKETEQREGCD